MTKIFNLSYYDFSVDKCVLNRKSCRLFFQSFSLGPVALYIRVVLLQVLFRPGLH